jgi:hypothetical protein
VKYKLEEKYYSNPQIEDMLTLKNSNKQTPFFYETVRTPACMAAALYPPTMVGTLGCRWMV